MSEQHLCVDIRPNPKSGDWLAVVYDDFGDRALISRRIRARSIVDVLRAIADDIERVETRVAKERNA